MAYRMPKLLSACLLGSLVLVAGRGAWAQPGGATGTTTAAALVKTDFTLYLQYEKGKDNWIQMNTLEQTYFFNRARCECVGDEENLSGHFRIAIQPGQNTSDKVRALLNQNTAGSGVARLYLGSNVVNCLAPSTAPTGTYSANCLNLLDPNDVNAGIEGGMATFAGTSRVWYSPPIPVAWLFNSFNSSSSNGSTVCSGSACNDTSHCGTVNNVTETVYFWAQTGSQLTPDMQDSSFNVTLMGQSTFVPENVSVVGVNRALSVSWTWPNGISPAANNAFMGVQLFCVRGPGYSVFKAGSFDPQYMTGPRTCGAAAPAAEPGIAGLDEAYLCSDLLPTTQNSYRITGLQNDIYYGVMVAAMDKYKNASVSGDLVYAAPIPTIDFYSQYKDSGGAAQGGYCALAGRPQAPGALALVGVAALGLLFWRRRRRGRDTTLLVLVAGTLAAGQAQARSAFRDDMAEVQDEETVWRGTPRKYAIEARFGMYTPDIDSETTSIHPPQVVNNAPHQYIFGNSKRPMWQLEFDYQIFQRFGTLALGGSIGYFKETAKACMVATLGASDCERSADDTGLRLIPLAALVIYRFDVLAEQWKIPLVPYGKLGLNYTFWNITDGNGNTPTSGNGKGAGGTAGWQAAVGLSLQIDFLDPSAAHGFDAEAGVNHTYAFFELTHVAADGLGSSGKLHVGDSTWFAGLMFEF